MKKYLPKVSVIMPAYNAEDTIGEAVASVLSQTMGELELIICDDASTDATLDVLARFESEPRVKILMNVKNMGSGLSRNRAIDAAEAPWIAVIDADDAWMPNRLEKLLASADKSNGRMVFDDIMTCHSVEGELVPWRCIHGVNGFGNRNDEFHDMEVTDYLRSPRLLIKPLIPRTAIVNANVRHSDRSFAQDAEFFLRLALSGVGFRYLPEPLYLYRIQPGSSTSRAGVKQMRECIQACSEWDGWTSQVKLEFDNKIRSLIHNETLYKLAENLREGRLVSAIKELISDPGVVAILPIRVGRHLSYQVHRVIHGGASRNLRDR